MAKTNILKYLKNQTFGIVLVITIVFSIVENGGIGVRFMRLPPSAAELFPIEYFILVPIYVILPYMGICKTVISQVLKVIAS